MPHVLRSTLVVLGILFGGWTDATPFTVELTVPSHSALPDMVYATVRGEVDPADNTVFHFSIELHPDLSTLLHGGDNFGIAGFWFNSDLLLLPAQFKNFTPAPTWAITASNPNCPGGCARGSGFGEFNMRLSWSGAPADRPEHLAFDIDFGSAVTEGNFNRLSVEKPPSSTHVGHFAIYLDGFDTTEAGERIRGTFVTDDAPQVEPCPCAGELRATLEALAADGAEVDNASFDAGFFSIEGSCNPGGDFDLIEIEPFACRLSERARSPEVIAEQCAATIFDDEPGVPFGDAIYSFFNIPLAAGQQQACIDFVNTLLEP